MERAQNYEHPTLAIRRKMRGIRAIAAFFSRDVLKELIRLRRHSHEILETARGERARVNGICGRAGKPQVRRARQDFPRGIHDEKNIAANMMLKHRLSRGSLRSAGFVRVL